MISSLLSLFKSGNIDCFIFLFLLVSCNYYNIYKQLSKTFSGSVTNILSLFRKHLKMLPSLLSGFKIVKFFILLYANFEHYDLKN